MMLTSTLRLAAPISLLFALLLAHDSASSQEPTRRTAALSEIPVGIAEEVTRRLNDPSTEIREGDVSLPAGSRIFGNLAVLDGDLAVAGAVDGELLVVNGDLRLQPGAEIRGGILVVGGIVVNPEVARIDGAIVSHDGEYNYERTVAGFRALPGRSPGASRRAETSDFLVTTGRSYNRVEGLPIAFGPRLRTAGSNPLRLQALAIYRTESGLTLDVERMGYYVRADQFLAGRRELRVGATLHSLVDPIEEWHLTDLETGLSTFFFHRDYRDHYERSGWSVFANWEPFARPFILHVEGRWERHEMRATGSPWSLFRNADPWRHQPAIAQGRLGSVVAWADYDTRSSTWNPASGWHSRVQLEHGFHTDLTYPELYLPGPADAPVILPAPPDYGRFLAGTLDVRSYNRVDADSRLNVRLLAGGSLTGDPLPPQRQHALGGEGTLPGYQLFSADCGARDAPAALVSGAEPSPGAFFYPYYGCDAVGLLQVEFRGKLAFRFRWDGGPWREDRDTDSVRDIGWDMSPDWSIFVDAGRGWSYHVDRRDESTLVNVGAGVLLDRIGLYLAVPVTSGSGVNLFVRLGPRF